MFKFMFEMPSGPYAPRLNRREVSPTAARPAIDLELVRTVAKDLRYLTTEWTPGVDDDGMRRDSSIVRRLLVHNTFGKAWREIGFDRQPAIVAERLDATAVQALGPVLNLATGRTITHGVTFFNSGMFVDDGRFTEPEQFMDLLAGLTKEGSVPLSQYLEDVCLQTAEFPVKRRQLIQYVAQKLGGDHYDPKRADDEEGRLHSSLDRLREAGPRYTDRDLVYLQMLNTVQTLARSPDVRRFLDAAEQMLAR